MQIKKLEDELGVKIFNRKNKPFVITELGQKIISQAKMRYQSLMSRSLRITVPMNLDLEAGDIISVKLIDSMKGTDEWMSGLYIIKDLKHSYITRKNGVQCYTFLRLIKDTPGDD